MPETASEYRLGQLDFGLKAMVAEVRALRGELGDKFEQHDLRDDERFGSHSARLAAIEQRDAVAIALAEQQRGALAGLQSWHYALMQAASPILAAIVAAGLTWLALHSH